MRILRLLSLLALVQLTACTKENDDTPQLEADRSEVVLFGVDGRTDSLIVTANIAWKATVPSTATWLTVQDPEGSGNRVLYFTNVGDNNLNEATTTLTLSDPENRIAPVNITITRKPYYSFLSSTLYGGTGNEGVSAITPGTDGGFVIAGSSDGYDGDFTPPASPYGGIHRWFMKIGSTGATEWKHTIGKGIVDIITRIIATPDGGYLAVGYSQSPVISNSNQNAGWSDAWAIKFTATGQVAWSRLYGGTDRDFFTAVIVDPEGGYLLTGHTYSKDGIFSGNTKPASPFMAKISHSGNWEWVKMYTAEGEGSFKDIATDGTNYWITGDIATPISPNNHNSGQGEIHATKVSAKGEKLSAFSWGGTGLDRTTRIISDRKDGFWILGSTNSTNSGNLPGQNHGLQDGLLIHIGSTGRATLTKYIGGAGWDYPEDIVATTDGGVVIAGYTNSTDHDAAGGSEQYDAWILRLDSRGNKIFNKTFPNADGAGFSAITRTTNNHFIMAGGAFANGSTLFSGKGKHDAWVLRFK